MVCRSRELYQFIFIPGTLQTIPLHSQIMWDNTSIMTKALSAGSPRGQPTLCWVFMLSHIPIISQWQRQELANVHQGASLLRAAPVKLSSRWDRVRFAPRRHVRERLCERERKREEDGKKEGSWSNRFLWRCWELVSRAAAHVYLLNWENTGPQRLISSHDAPKQHIFRCVSIQEGNLMQTREKNTHETQAVRWCTGSLATGKAVISVHYVKWRIRLASLSIWLPFSQIIPPLDIHSPKPTQNWPPGTQIAINYDISWLQGAPFGDLT